MEVGVDLTLILIGAFGIFYKSKNFVLISFGLAWGIVFPPLIKKIRIEKTLTLRTLLGFVLVMYIPFFAMSYLLLIVSSMVFGGMSSLVVDLKWQRAK